MQVSPASLPAAMRAPASHAESLARQQRRAVRWVGLAGLAYSAAFGAAVAAWVQHLGLASPAHHALCALPALLCAALQGAPVREARQALLRFIAAVMFAPLVLLAWGASLAPADRPAPIPAHLDLERLMTGAAAVQSAGSSGNGMVLMRSAGFADGTELRLTRLADEAVAARYLAFTGEALQGRWQALGERPGLRFSAPSGWVIHAERHGADVLEVRARDEPSALARLAAQGLTDLPDAGAPASLSNTAPAFEAWPFVLSAGTLHALALLALLVGSGLWTTAVPAAPGATVVNAGTLRERLLSVQEAGLRCSVYSASPHEVEVELSGHAGRSRRVVLRLDETERRVRVLEHLSSDGAAPQDDEEADMQGPGADGIDPARPPAHKVWGRMRQTTLVVPEWLAHLAPRFDAADGLRLVASRRFVRLDGDGAVSLLCAVVTASGWSWQPRLWLRG